MTTHASAARPSLRPSARPPSARPPQQTQLLQALDELSDELGDEPGDGRYSIPDEAEDAFLKRAVSRSGQHRLQLPPR